MVDSYLHLIQYVVQIDQRSEGSVVGDRLPLSGASSVRAAFRGKEFSVMESIATRSLATAERRTSKEHFGTRLAAGTLIVLGGLGLTGCAADGEAASTTSVTPSPSATETVSPLGNDLTVDELREIDDKCPFDADTHGFDNVTKIPDDKAALVMQVVRDTQKDGPGCDAAAGVVSDWMHQQ